MSAEISFEIYKQKKKAMLKEDSENLWFKIYL